MKMRPGKNFGLGLGERQWQTGPCPIILTALGPAHFVRCGEWEAGLRVLSCKCTYLRLAAPFNLSMNSL